MPEPIAFLQALRASTADLLQGLDEQNWGDAELTAPSLLDGWTRGHLLTHLARNADGITATVSGGLRGEIVARYPDGWDARNAAISDGASRPYSAQVADLVESGERLDRVFTAVGEADKWDVPTDDDRPARDWLLWRVREVEVHRVDLDAGYSPQQWPPIMVAELFASVAATLPDRATCPVRVEVTADGSLGPDHVGSVLTAGEGSDGVVEVSGPDWAVLAWLVGRGGVVGDALTATPELRPWR